MRSDDIPAATRDIMRRLGWDKTKLVHLFGNSEPRLATGRRKPARTRTLVAAVAFAGLVILGPRILSEREIKVKKTPPLPRTSPATNVAVPPDVVSGPAALVTSPVAVVDLLLSPPTSVANAS
jgi:hypothetical protein